MQLFFAVLGRFSDISARQFFAVQTDLEYRRKWDDLVVNINIIDENKQTDEQVLRWISYFPVNCCDCLCDIVW